jgi:hypothetical protein
LIISLPPVLEAILRAMTSLGQQLTKQNSAPHLLCTWLGLDGVNQTNQFMRGEKKDPPLQAEIHKR